MRKLPIVLTFDNNMSFAAGVCICSILESTSKDIFVDFYILHSGEKPKIIGKDTILNYYPNTNITYRSVGTSFTGAYETRGITSAAYYRLLAPELIPEYDRVIYADVDILFRRDLYGLIDMDLGNCYVAAVKAVSLNKTAAGKAYLSSIGLDANNYFVSGFLVMDLAAMRATLLVKNFKALAQNNYKYQDQDILNIVCKNHIMEIPQIFSLGASAIYTIAKEKEGKQTEYSEHDYLYNSNIHYNGAKPWKDWCPYIDLWWEFYRKSPIFDHKLYFDFYSDKLNHLDKLSLIKRIKILVRYFFIGKK